MLIYAAIGAFGLLFLLIMLFVGEIFGGDHDLHAGDVGGGHEVGHAEGHGGPSVFSARVMASFLTAFGVGGVVARYNGLSHPVASATGIGTGLVMATLVYQFAKMLYSQQASSEVRVASLVGLNAEVSVAIPPHGPGQVVVSLAGERSSHIARSRDGAPVPQGTDVVITGISGEGVVVDRAPVEARPKA